MGAELDERTIAAEADLLERAVSFTKGCYTGQELVARLDARGNNVARQLRGLVVAARRGGGVRRRASAALVGAGRRARASSVGTVTSAAWSPALGCTVALAYVHRSVTEPGAVELADEASRATRRVGGGAEVRSLPLV